MLQLIHDHLSLILCPLNGFSARMQTEKSRDQTRCIRRQLQNLTAQRNQIYIDSLWLWRGHPCIMPFRIIYIRMIFIWGINSYSYSYSHWSLIHKCFEFLLSILILNVQRTSISFKSWFEEWEFAGSVWLRFGILTFFI